MADEVNENGHPENGDVPEIELIIRVSRFSLTVLQFITQGVTITAKGTIFTRLVVTEAI